MTLARGWRRHLGAALCLASGALSADDLTPHQWLDRMNDAVRQLDYEGRFVVQIGDHLDALYLVHRVVNGEEKERIVSLTGDPREIIRSDEAVACLVPGRDKHINVGRRAGDRSFSPLRGVSAGQLSQYYRMQALAPERVAGRHAMQILIEPQDEFRFGYRLFIDQKTALPLRSVMFDEVGAIVSQSMFVDLKTEGQITPIEHDLFAMQLARATQPPPMSSARLSQPGWHVSDVPPGYQLNVHRRRAVSEGMREHLVFSDGLATVSVYVQPARGAAIKGMQTVGAARAIGRLIGDHEAVVIGEVPLKTLQWFAQHVSATTE